MTWGLFIPPSPQSAALPNEHLLPASGGTVSGDGGCGGCRGSQTTRVTSSAGSCVKVCASLSVTLNLLIRVVLCASSSRHSAA